MKTFEVYRIESDTSRTLVASVQADYYESDNYRVQFFQKRFFGRDRETGRLNCSFYLLVADTEFLLAPPEPTTPLAEYFPNFPSLDPCHAPQPDPEPTPRRRKSKGSTLGLD